MKKITIYENESCKQLGDLFGLFFEDLNHATDGGMYGELVQNRSFEYCEIDRQEYNGFTAWERSRNCFWEISTENPIHSENQHYLHVKAECGDWIANSGYNTGIYVQKGKKYDFSLWARCPETMAGEIEVAVREDQGETLYAEGHLMLEGAGWKKYELVLEASETTYKGRLRITFLNAGCYELDLISLFPQDTFCGRMPYPYRESG